MSKWDQGPGPSAASGSKWDVGGPRPSAPLQFANSARPAGGMGGCGGGPMGCGGGCGGCGGPGFASRFSSEPPSRFSSGPPSVASRTTIDFPSRRTPVVMAPPKPPSNVAYMGKGGPSVPLISTMGRAVPVMGARPGAAFTNPHNGMGGMPNLRPGMPGFQAMPPGVMPSMPNLRPAGYFAPGVMPGMPNLRPGMAGYQPGLATPAPLPKRSLSPHAGSRAMKEMLIAQQQKGMQGQPVPAPEEGRDRSRSSKRKRSSSSESSSSSSSSKKKKKKKKRTRSSSSEGEKDAANQVEESEEVQKAKIDALQKLTSLQSVEPKDARIKGYRALLREWHPDKNPDRLEVATAVFQFLQKGKRLLNL